MLSLVRRESVPTRTPYYYRNTWQPLRLIDELMGLESFGSSLGQSASFVPSFEFRETKEGYEITADVPGVEEENLDISVTGNQVTVSGKREGNKTEENERCHCSERFYGSFSRSFTLPEGVDSEHLTASLEKGVLTLMLPKKPEVQPKRIELTKSE